MTSKLKKIPSYLRELLFMLIFRPLGAIGRHICPSLRGLWLISERGTDARDNGYRFYSYLVSEQPEVNARYVITPGSPDRPLIDKLGGAVNYRSPRHYIMYYAADALISTHVQPAAPDKVIYFRLAQHGLHARGRQVYLKHGIINNAMDWLHYGSLYIDLFVCGAKPEYDHVRSTFGFPEGVVRYLGLCRYDSLQEPGSGERMILLMPTWRGLRIPVGRCVLRYRVLPQLPARCSQVPSLRGCSRRATHALFSIRISRCSGISTASERAPTVLRSPMPAATMFSSCCATVRC